MSRTAGSRRGAPAEPEPGPAPAEAPAAGDELEALHEQVSALRAQLDAAERARQELPPDNGAVPLARVAKQLGRGALPRDSGAYRAARGAYVWARETRRRFRSYRHWSAGHDATPGELAEQRKHSIAAPGPSVVAFVVETPGRDAAATVASLEGQSWQHWQLVTVEGAGALPARVRETAPDAVALILAGGDTLAPDALFHVAAAFSRDPTLDAAYWDDDVVGGGRRTDPRFRSGWSPELLLGQAYTGRSVAARAGRLAEACELGAAGADEVAWISLVGLGPTAHVTRLPRVLGHLAARDEPTPARRAELLRAAGAGPAGSVAVSAGSDVTLQWDLPRWPKVSIVILTRHHRANLERLFAGLAGTDYPEYEVIVVDNGARTEAAEAWYAAAPFGVSPRVTWSEGPFNYSAANNSGAALANGDVLVFLNDDTEVLDRTWLRHLAGWAQTDGIGCVGSVLLDGAGRVQHAGAFIGVDGFAGHLFQGMAPGTPSLFGPAGGYRNVLAVTGACVAVSRATFDTVGGWDERFVLCGSDVALGLAAFRRGLRNVCIGVPLLRHHESTTRGVDIPAGDFHASYWEYQKYLNGGDPYLSPSISLASHEPRLRFPEEPTAVEMVSPVLGKKFTVFRQTNDTRDSALMATFCKFSPEQRALLADSHAAVRGSLPVRSVNWFIPGIDSPHYGGIATALRLADHMTREHGVAHRFIAWDLAPPEFTRAAINNAFPALAGSEVRAFHELDMDRIDVPPADAAIATLWVTAYIAATLRTAPRNFYLVQDFEPMFYPGGTMYALAEETYSLGLYGLCNSMTLRDVYRGYGGAAMGFVPAVDGEVFHARGRRVRQDGEPLTLFVYARPGHWRNCWELASLALREVKRQLGDRLRVVAAGSWAIPEDLEELRFIEHLGLLDYAETGRLYRECDLALTLAVSKHPSYLPLELMACGVPVVALHNPATEWLLRDGETCVGCHRTVDSIRDGVLRLVGDAALRSRLAAAGLEQVRRNHADWSAPLEEVYAYMCAPGENA